MKIRNRASRDAAELVAGAVLCKRSRRSSRSRDAVPENRVDEEIGTLIGNFRDPAYIQGGGDGVMMLDMLHLDEDEIAKVGQKALAQARAAGVPAYYIDEARGGGIVKVMPDGTIQLIDQAAMSTL